MMSAIAIAKVRLAAFLTLDFDSSVLQLMTQDNSCSVYFSNFKFKYHVTEYFAVIGTHSTMQGDEQLSGHVTDPFPEWVWPCETITSSDSIVWQVKSRLVPDILKGMLF